MNIRERVMAVFHHEKPDRIPWLIYNIYAVHGSIFREMRKMGLGIIGGGIPGASPQGFGDRVHSATDMGEYLSTMEMPHVKVKQVPITQNGKVTVTTTYETPVGNVSEKERLDVCFEPWKIEYVIKDLSDYEVVKFIIDDIVVRPTYEEYLESERWLGDDGYCRGMLSYGPFQTLLLTIMGYHRLAIDIYNHRKEFEKLLRVVEKKQIEICRVMANSPAKVVLIDANINGRVTSPKLFKEYCMPFYEKVIPLFHKNDKIVQVHFDGAEKSLKTLIAKTDIDVIEAFTPPPMGDLPFSEARTAWKDKVIAANFPETVLLYGPEAVKKETFEILRSVAPGDNFMLTITEDMERSVMAEGLMTITKIMRKYGTYPIRPEKFPSGY